MISRTQCGHWVGLDGIHHRGLAVGLIGACPAGQSSVSQAVAQSAKSAIRGSRSRRTWGRSRKPSASAPIAEEQRRSEAELVKIFWEPGLFRSLTGWCAPPTLSS
jgi:hypothetical protein